MGKPDSTVAQRIAEAASTFEQRASSLEDEMTDHKTVGRGMTAAPSNEVLRAALGRRGNDPQFRRLLQVIPLAAYTCDAEGLITYFNDRAGSGVGP